jgi:hypothetical protein
LYEDSETSSGSSGLQAFVAAAGTRSRSFFAIYMLQVGSDDKLLVDVIRF